MRNLRRMELTVVCILFCWLSIRIMWGCRVVVMMWQFLYIVTLVLNLVTPPIIGIMLAAGLSNQSLSNRADWWTHKCNGVWIFLFVYSVHHIGQYVGLLQVGLL
jgi:chromate transport protein ChrA